MSLEELGEDELMHIIFSNLQTLTLAGTSTYFHFVINRNLASQRILRVDVDDTNIPLSDFLCRRMTALDHLEVTGRSFALRVLKQATMLDFSTIPLSSLDAIWLAPHLRANRLLHAVRPADDWLNVELLSSFGRKQWRTLSEAKRTGPLFDCECCLIAGMLCIPQEELMNVPRQLCGLWWRLGLWWRRRFCLELTLMDLGSSSGISLAAAEQRCGSELFDCRNDLHESAVHPVCSAQLALHNYRNALSAKRQDQQRRSCRIHTRSTFSLMCSHMPVAGQLGIGLLLLVALRMQEDVYARQTGYSGALCSQHPLRVFNVRQRRYIEGGNTFEGRTALVDTD